MIVGRILRYHLLLAFVLWVLVATTNAAPVSHPQILSDFYLAQLDDPAQPIGQTLLTSEIPGQVNLSDGAGVNYELGMRFTSNTPGQITAIRFWKADSETGSHVGTIWSASGQLLASVTFTGESVSGWQQQLLTTPLAITANTEYVVSVNTGNSFYVATDNGLAQQITNQHLSSIVNNNGVYGSPGAFPTSSYLNSNYFRDVVFIAAPAFMLSGSVSPASDANGATITLSGAASANTTVNANGTYSFSGLLNGSYTITPSKAGFSFNPPSQTLTVNGGDVVANGFTITPKLSSLLGSITPADGGSGATMTLSGAVSRVTTVNTLGNYSFSGLAAGNYLLTPSKSGFAFNPLNQQVMIASGDVTGVNFSAMSAPGGTFSISGTITPGAQASGTVVLLSGPTNGTATVNANGGYLFTGVPPGNYTLTPVKAGASFLPGSKAVNVTTANVSGVDFALQTTRVYVTNSDSNSISVIDASTNTVIGTVPVGIQPFALTVTADGRYAYVTNFQSNSVTVVDTVSLKQVKEIPVGMNPVGVTISPDGSVAYVANYGSSTISVIDTATLVEIATIPVVNPIWVAFTADGRSAYVTNNSAGRVSVIDTMSRTVQNQIAVGNVPVAIAIAPNGSRAYVTNADDGTVSVIDLQSNTVVDTVIAASSQGDAVSPDGQLVYVTENHAFDVSVITTNNDVVWGRIPVDKGPGDLGPDGVGFTSNGAFAYVANRGSNTVSVIDVANGVVVNTISVGLGPTGIAIRP